MSSVLRPAKPSIELWHVVALGITTPHLQNRRFSEVHFFEYLESTLDLIARGNLQPCIEQPGTIPNWNTCALARLKWCDVDGIAPVRLAQIIADVEIVPPNNLDGVGG